MRPVNTNVRSEHLDGVSAMNSESNINFIGIKPLLKGGLNPLNNIPWFQDAENATDPYQYKCQNGCNYGNCECGSWRRNRLSYFRYLYYHLIISISIGRWIWENLPNDITSHDLEYNVGTRGSIAMIKVGTRQALVSYEGIGNPDIYGDYDKIKVQEETSFMNGVIFNKDSFVIIPNDFDKLSQISKAMIFVDSLIDALDKINNDMITMQDVVIKYSKKSTDGESQSVIRLNIAQENGNKFTEIVYDSISEILAKNKNGNMFEIIEGKSKSTELIQIYEFLWEQTGKYMAFPEGSWNVKNRNVLNKETQNEKAVTDYVISSMKQIREKACKRIKEVFGVETTIQTLEEFRDREMAELDSGGTIRNEGNIQSSN